MHMCRLILELRCLHIAWEPFSYLLKNRFFLNTDQIKKKKSQSTESTDGGGCLKFYRPLELIGIYAETKKTKKKKPLHKQY